MKEKFKIGLFVIIIGMLFLPLLQFSSNYFEENVLRGSYKLAEKPKIISRAWFSSKFQNKYDRYFDDHLGFRPFFVRLHNQLKYSVYEKVSTQEVIVGKNNILYDERHINALFGNDFIGSNIIKRQTKRIREVKKALAKEGKELLIVLAPNKARYFRNEVPDRYKEIDTTNYEVYLKCFKEDSINYIDFNDWFLTQKKTGGPNLVPKYGIHWTEYGRSFVADSLINYCNKNYGYELINYKTVNTIKTNVPSEEDYDLGKTLNLFTAPKDETYIYEDRVVIPNQKKKKKLLSVGDSFFLSMEIGGFTKDVFDPLGFWYYNKNVLIDTSERRKHSDDLQKVLPETDLIVIMLTEWNMYRFGFGVIEELDNYYYNTPIENSWVRHYIFKIRSDKVWMKSVIKQAKEREISVDSMIVNTAKDFVKQKRLEGK